MLILATIQSLSRTVGNVEFPIAASSGRQASLYNKSNASLWVTSTKQFRISFRKSSSTSEYTVLKDGVNLPVVVHLASGVHTSSLVLLTLSFAFFCSINFVSCL